MIETKILELVNLNNRVLRKASQVIAATHPDAPLRSLDALHLAYFEIERQLLAQMKHPAIAQVYDAGTTPDGYPYFAMEFIHGVPLRQYAEAHKLGVRQRLELMAKVCDAVEHAHDRSAVPASG